MSWEAGQISKTIEASWWGVVTTLWLPCFRTQTHTQASWSSVCNEVKEVCGKRRMAWEHMVMRGRKIPLTFFSGHMSTIWVTGGKTCFAMVNRQWWIKRVEQWITNWVWFFIYFNYLVSWFDLPRFFIRLMIVTQSGWWETWKNHYQAPGFLAMLIWLNSAWISKLRSLICIHGFANATSQSGSNELIFKKPTFWANQAAKYVSIM